MRALAVVPGQPGSLRLVDLPTPALADIDDGRGVGVRVLQVGLCGTDREISEGLYGALRTRVNVTGGRAEPLRTWHRASTPGGSWSRIAA
jgi:threonine dehydrogenase-like Zn-dependent dehydrogenase